MYILIWLLRSEIIYVGYYINLYNCPHLHIIGWFHWMFRYFPVMLPPVCVHTRIVPCLCVGQAFGYSPQVLFGLSVLSGYLSGSLSVSPI